MRCTAIFPRHVVVVSHGNFEVWHKQWVCTEQASFLGVCDPLIGFIFRFSNVVRRISIFCRLMVTSSVALAAVFS